MLVDTSESYLRLGLLLRMEYSNLLDMVLPNSTKGRREDFDLACSSLERKLEIYLEGESKRMLADAEQEVGRR